LEFIKEHWSKICKMLDWCINTVDPNDGLMQIAAGDWGSSESSFAVSKDTQMAGMWVCALREMAYLARAMGDEAMAERCRQMAQKASNSLEQKLWDPETSTYYWGLDRAGKPLRSLVPHHSVSIWMQTLSSERIPKVLERMACSDFQTDWGVRSLSALDKRFDPKGYQTGTVWPVWNAGVIIGDYRYGRQVQAFRNWMAMIRLRTLYGLGPMPEVLHGRYYKRLNTGVPHQMFSEVAVQNGFYEGLLGLEIDLPASLLKLAPRLPAVWDRLKVKRIPIGSERLDINICRVPALRGPRHNDIYEVTFDLQTADKLTVLLEPLLPAGSCIETVEFDGKPISFRKQTICSAVIVAVKIENCQGKHTLCIHHHSGIDFMPEDRAPQPGEQSHHLHLIKAEFTEKQWRFTVEGLAQTVYPITFFTSQLPTHIVGGRLLDHRKGAIRIGLQSPSNAIPKTDDYVRWDAKVSWK
jgi:hypothetical protein